MGRGVEHGPDVLICNRDLPLVAWVGGAEGAPCHHVGLERSRKEGRYPPAEVFRLLRRPLRGFTSSWRFRIFAAWRPSYSRLTAIDYHPFSETGLQDFKCLAGGGLLPWDVTTACRQLRSLGPEAITHTLSTPSVTTACRQLRSLGLGYC